MIDLRNGDCITKMKEMEENSVDFILCDPPYELNFMSKRWDNTGIAFNTEMWKEALRVLKPGGYLMAFSGTRTYHRMTVAIEDAGFEIKDMIEWVYGSGFPKALDISKALNKKSNPSSDIAKQYEGYKTQLKPAHEPICLAMKPLSEKTFAENVMKWGTGGLNIDKTRINFVDEYDKNQFINDSNGINREKTKEKCMFDNSKIRGNHNIEDSRMEGRFPANFIISENIAPILDKQSDKASRFFKNIEEDKDYIPFVYHAKASKKDRNININGEVLQCNNHTTVKPTGLIKYLLKMGLPPIHNAVVLDMFAGSGTTGIALEMLNKEEGTNHKCILIEREEEYAEIIKKRCCL